MRIDKTTPLYCVSLTDGDQGNVARISIRKLFDMVKGGTSTKDIMLFTEEEEAEEYGSRLSLVQRGQAMLESMETEVLKAIVDAIEPENIENTLEGFGVYTE